MENTVKQRRGSFLKYVRDTYNPKIIYYPASGGDSFPKEIFGQEAVIHLSLKNDEPKYHYFKNLGDGIKIFGRMEDSPIADDSVDAILVRFGFSMTGETIKDFNRVLKLSGIVIIEGFGWKYSDRSKWDKLCAKFSHYKSESLPEEFTPGQIVFGAFPENDYSEGIYFKDEEKMHDFLKTNRLFTGFQEILDYAIFTKTANT